MNFKYLLLAAATCVASTTAYAQEEQPTGFYAGLNAGIATVGDTTVTYYGDLDAAAGDDTLATSFDFKSAATFGGVVGYDFGMFRADLEVSYARNKVKSFTVESLNGSDVTLDPTDRAELCDYLEVDTCGGSGNTFAIDGSRARQLNALANVWVDLPLGPVTPYAGGGLGVAGFEVDGEGKAEFAWQLGAGVSFQVTPGLALTADYRHREVKGADIEWDEFSGLRTSKLKTDSFTAGIRAYF